MSSKSKKTLRVIAGTVIFAMVIGAIYCLMAPPKVTFNQDVSSIIYENCTPCHREGEIAPFSFSNYQDVYEYADQIKEVTALRYMPPWPADPTYTHFFEERILTQEQIDLLADWADTGAPEGEGPPPAVPDFPPDAQIGKPDLVLSLTEPFDIPTTGQDVFKLFVMPFNNDTSVLVKALEFRPGNKRRVHHAWYFEDTTAYFSLLDSLKPGYAWDFFQGENFFPLPPDINSEGLREYKTRSLQYIMDGGSAYTPGSSPRIYPEGMARRFHPQTKLLTQIHYVGSARKDFDQSKVNVYFPKEKIEREVKFVIIDDRFLVSPPLFIKAGEVKTIIEEYKVPEDISLISIGPHMHFRGASMLVYALSLTGDTTRLLRIRNWDFNWQGLYNFSPLVKIEKDWIIRVEGTYDNSTENPANPVLPPIDVEWGYRSVDEMLGAFIEWVPYQEGDENIKYEQGRDSFAREKADPPSR